MIEVLPTTKTKPRHPLRWNLLLLVAFMAYQFILCFINTNVTDISNPVVAAIEAFLLVVTAWRVFPTCRMNEVAAVFLVLVYFAVLWMIRGDVDPAGPRNVLIMLLAFALGRASPDRDAANKAVWIISALVLVVAGAEYFFTDAYLRVFNILHYYIARGEVQATGLDWVKQDTFVSGFRPGGRNMLPFLGDIRVSSIFLEPVSMGNYAIVLCCWALSFDKAERGKAIKHFIVAVLLIIACDSRFASILVFALLLARFVPLLQKRWVIQALPWLTVAGLLGFTLLGLGAIGQDNLPGRLMGSGEAVIHMDFAQFLGFGIPDPLGDMGVAYSLEHFGVFLCVVLWIAFALPKLRDARASRYRLLLALYGLDILLISGTSFYSAKTAVLAWFLYGVLYASPQWSAKSENQPLAGSWELKG